MCDLELNNFVPQDEEKGYFSPSKNMKMFFTSRTTEFENSLSNREATDYLRLFKNK